MVFDEDDLFTRDLVDEVDFLYGPPAGSNETMVLTGRYSPQIKYVFY